MHYLAFAYPNDEGGYGFTVPDIMGFSADAGEATLDESLAVARRVLADHIAALVDAGREVPAARRPEEILADQEFEEDRETAAFVTILPVIIPTGRTLRLNISLDEGTLDVIDRAANDRGLSRSAFIAEASRRFALGDMGRSEDRQTFEALTENEGRRLSEAISTAAGPGNRLRGAASFGHARSIIRSKGTFAGGGEPVPAPAARARLKRPIKLDD